MSASIERMLELSELVPVKTWRPTAFDHSPTGLEDDRKSWLVAPCSRTRDSETLELSNWESMLKMLGDADPSGDDYEVHEFSHWGPGWYRIAIMRPGSKAHHEAVRIEMGLADSPCVDESDYLDREHEQQLERITDIIRGIDRDTHEWGDPEWDCEALAAEVAAKLTNGLSESTARATEQVTAILVELGHLVTPPDDPTITDQDIFPPGA